MLPHTHTRLATCALANSTLESCRRGGRRWSSYSVFTSEERTHKNVYFSNVYSQCWSQHWHVWWVCFSVLFFWLEWTLNALCCKLDEYTTCKILKRYFKILQCVVTVCGNVGLRWLVFSQSSAFWNHFHKNKYRWPCRIAKFHPRQINNFEGYKFPLKFRVVVTQVMSKDDRGNLRENLLTSPVLGPSIPPLNWLKPRPHQARSRSRQRVWFALVNFNVEATPEVCQHERECAAVLFWEVKADAFWCGRAFTGCEKNHMRISFAEKYHRLVP